MYIRSLELRNILTYGPEEQILSDFRHFNLFIGKNASGKSKTLEILGNLQVKVADNLNQEIVHWYGREQLAQKTIIALTDDFACNRLPYKENIGDIKIIYTIQCNNGIEEEKIVFENGLLCEGNIQNFQKDLHFILPEWNDNDFIESIYHYGHRLPIAKVDFALSYIFERYLRIRGFGILLENHTFQDEMPIHIQVGESPGWEDLRSTWSDGLLRVAKVILQMQSGLVFLVDEPELHLEPRAIRRLISFLTWLGTPESEVSQSNDLVEIERQWQSFVDPYRSYYQFNDKGPVKSQNRRLQFFISSHSSILIHELATKIQDAAIFDFNLSWKNNNIDKKKLIMGTNTAIAQMNSNQNIIKQQSLFTRVRRIEGKYHDILDNLGCKGSDLLQCNGVVWVEGPSDVIYLKKWLEMFAAEERRSALVQGQHFEFQMYGGTMLDSLCMIKGGSDEEAEKRMLIEMFSFSRNAYLITDSDAVRLVDGSIADASTFFRAKQFMRDEIQRLNQNGYQLGLWYAENDTELRTIEDYVDDVSKESVGKSLTKKVRAQRIVSSWGPDKSLNDFHHELRCEIEKLDKTIRDWQR